MEKKTGKVKGGKYLENENIFVVEEKKNKEGKVFGEGRYMFFWRGMDTYCCLSIALN